MGSLDEQAAARARTEPAAAESVTWDRAAMAAMGPGPHRSGSVAVAHGKRTTQVGPVRRSLIRQGLCYAPRHDVIAFTVPMFDDFVRRHIG